jgi:hypothetical protein
MGAVNPFMSGSRLNSGGATSLFQKGPATFPNDGKDSAAHDPDFLRHQIIEGVKRGAALLQRTDPSEAKTQSDQANTTADELLKVLADENQGRADRLYKGLELLLVPPVGLLIFGGVIAWVAAGFRKVTEPGV